MTDLKNTTDDALPNYLNSLKFRQSHYYTDVRHALGFSAVLIAAATFGLDYKYGWDKTKNGTLWAVLAYFILNSALSLWIWRVEQGCIYSGERKDTKVDHVLISRMSNPTNASKGRDTVTQREIYSHLLPYRSIFQARRVARVGDDRDSVSVLPMVR